VRLYLVIDKLAGRIADHSLLFGQVFGREKHRPKLVPRSRTHRPSYTLFPFVLPFSIFLFHLNKSFRILRKGQQIPSGSLNHANLCSVRSSPNSLFILLQSTRSRIFRTSRRVSTMASTERLISSTSHPRTEKTDGRKFFDRR
jgi:hypothetical protein